MSSAVKLKTVARSLKHRVELIRNAIDLPSPHCVITPVLFEAMLDNPAACADCISSMEAELSRLEDGLAKHAMVPTLMMMMMRQQSNLYKRRNDRECPWSHKIFRLRVYHTLSTYSTYCTIPLYMMFSSPDIFNGLRTYSTDSGHFQRSPDIFNGLRSFTTVSAN